jgi:PncC family amidohydrolase
MNLFEEDHLNTLRNYLLKKGESVAVAESVTSGLLQFAISNTLDTMQFFQGGITAYNANQKFRQLGIEPMHALSVNCVSDQVATEMALQICFKFNSDWGVGITGYASPVPESGNKLFAYFAIAYKNHIKASGKLESDGPAGSDVQLYYVNEVLRHMAEATKVANNNS